MEQNNFEKNVQQKLDELKITPSDAVWTNVKDRIAKKKKDRGRMIIIFLLFLFMFSGGYWFFYSAKNHQSNHKQTSNFLKTTRKPALGATPKTDGPDSSLLGIATSPGKMNSTKNPQKSLLLNPTGKEGHNATLKSDKKTVADMPGNTRKIPAVQNRPVTGILANKGENEIMPMDVLPKIPGDSANRKISPKIVSARITKDSLSQAEAGKIKNNMVQNQKPVAKVSPEIRSKYPWAAAITVSAGTAFTTLSEAGYASANFTSYSPGVGNSGSQSGVRPSPIQNSSGFIAGAFMEKKFSGGIKMSSGISYVYFSLVNRIGSRIDSVSSFTSAFSNSSASNWNTYRNNFYFLEIPVTITFQLNKHQRVPLFWNAGINISQLLSSNALQYHWDPPFYYLDNTFFNKTQLGFHTGFSAMFFSGEKMPFTIGPTFYYSASKLSGKGLYHQKHFSFIGIQADILFRKK